MLVTMIGEWSDETHPVTSRLKSQDLYPPLFEEAEFRLVQCYWKQNNDSDARNTLLKMIKNYLRAEKKNGVYYAQVWEEQGKAALLCHEYDTALHCFDEALKTQSSEEPRLNLWILQSEAFRGKKEYGVAMRLLSRVINTETNSPLRLKAMFLRAEIYEAQGRPELALRQLEAAAKSAHRHMTYPDN